MTSVDLYCTRPELKPDFYKWNTSVCGHQQPLISCGEYVPMGDEYFQLADSFAECARNNDTICDNYITPPLDWMMVGENQVIFCFALLFFLFNFLFNKASKYGFSNFSKFNTHESIHLDNVFPKNT